MFSITLTIHKIVFLLNYIIILIKGKTMLICWMTLEYLAKFSESKDEKILICAQSNTGVDMLLKKLLNLEERHYKRKLFIYLFITYDTPIEKSLKIYKIYLNLFSNWLNIDIFF